MFDRTTDLHEFVHHFSSDEMARAGERLDSVPRSREEMMAFVDRSTYSPFPEGFPIGSLNILF